MEAVVDTNALVYDYVEDSQFHDEATGALDGLDRWLIPSVVLEEFVFVMKKAGLEDKLLGRKLGELLKDGRTLLAPMDRTTLEGAIGLLSAEKTSFIRFNDKLVLSVAKRRKAPLLTFDRELKAQSRNFGVKVIP